MRIRVVQDEGREVARASPGMPLATIKTFYLAGSEMGRPWKVRTEEWQSMTSVFSGIEASLQRAEWT